MGVISFNHRGNFNNTEKFLRGYNARKILNVLEKYGQRGVQALSAATPIDSGTTASSWNYTVSSSGNSYTITWTNSSLTTTGTPIAIFIQYGHGTRQGGYVQGQDFINPALRPVFDTIVEEAWKEVRSL